MSKKFLWAVAALILLATIASPVQTFNNFGHMTLPGLPELGGADTGRDFGCEERLNDSHDRGDMGGPDQEQSELH